RGRTDVGTELGVTLLARLDLQVEVLVLVEKLPLLDFLLTRVEHDVARVVQHPLELLERDVEQVAHRRGQRLEEPDVGHRHRQLDVTHPLATNLREGHLDAAPVADHAAIANPLVLAARALPVLDRTEDPLAEQAVLLGLERAIVDRLGLGDLTPRPPVALSLHLEPLALLGIARPPDLL